MPETFDPLAMNILQDVDFDPMAILKGDVKLDNTKPIVKTDDSGDGGKDDKGKAPAGDAKPKLEIDLTDDMLATGLKRASGKEPAPGGSDDAGDKKPDDKGKPAAPAATDKTNAFAVHYNLMVEAGEWEPIEGFDGTEAKYIEARQINDEKRAVGITEGWFTEAFQQNPEGMEMGKLLFNHLRNGGRVSDFQNMMAPLEFDFKAIESEDDTVAEDAAKELIRRYYSSIGWKPEKINAKITNSVKLGQIVDEAKQIEEPYKDLLEVQRKHESERLAAVKQARDRQAYQLQQSLVSLLEKNEGYGPIKLWTNKKEKQEYENYIFAPDPETQKTAFNEELNAELKNPKFVLFLAAALKQKLYENPDALGKGVDTGDQKALKSIQGTLQNALLNKDISKVDNSHSQNQGNQSKYQFDLDKAVVIS